MWLIFLFWHSFDHLVYLEFFQISKMERFAKMVNGFKKNAPSWMFDRALNSS